MIHDQPSPLANTLVRIPRGPLAGSEIQIEDWWDRITGKSWMECDGNPACLQYAFTSRAPINNEVLYGKIGGLGHLVHVIDLEPVD